MARLDLETQTTGFFHDGKHARWEKRMTLQEYIDMGRLKAGSRLELVHPLNKSLAIVYVGNCTEFEPPLNSDQVASRDWEGHALTHYNIIKIETWS